MCAIGLWGPITLAAAGFFARGEPRHFKFQIFRGPGSHPSRFGHPRARSQNLGPENNQDLWRWKGTWTGEAKRSSGWSFCLPNPGGEPGTTAADTVATTCLDGVVGRFATTYTLPQSRPIRPRITPEQIGREFESLRAHHSFEGSGCSSASSALEV
jgi:hypothetical protein